MGLGESASAGATLYALMVLGVALSVGLVIYWLVLGGTGRQRPALISLAAWTALVLAVPVSSYFSADARADRGEQRRAVELLEAVSASAGVETEPSSGPQSRECGGDVSRRRWELAGSGDAGSADVLARFDAALSEDGFTTTRSARRPPLQPRGDVIGRSVVGVRGRASVLVQQRGRDELGTGRYRLVVEDGCGQLTHAG